MRDKKTYDGQPDNDQVMQDETPPMPVIPVRVEGPVRTQELPARSAGYATVLVDNGGTKILSADPLRKGAFLLPIEQDLWIGDSQAKVLVRSATSTPAGALWPAGTPFPSATCDEVWVSCALHGSTTLVSVISEQWAL